MTIKTTSLLIAGVFFAFAGSNNAVAQQDSVGDLKSWCDVCADMRKAEKVCLKTCKAFKPKGTDCNKECGIGSDDSADKLCDEKCPTGS